MNAVEIEEALTNLAEQEYNSATFPYAFLEAFGNKKTTLKRLKSGASNASDIEGGVLQRNNIHMVVCDEGKTSVTLALLKASPATKKAKAKFILAADGRYLEAEEMLSGETIACDYKDFPNHFGFFLPLAGISTVKQIRNNPIDIQATGRLNRLYIALLQQNEAWATDQRRAEMNQFMTRLIFCFFAEDTEIFRGGNLFTQTIEQMSDSRTDNTDYVIAEIFRAMDTPIEQRKTADLPRWADGFPYVNGGLFAGNYETPKFSRIARSYLIHAGHLNWKKINPDIFGSMIQAVADEDERGELGLHYTSVPNILKVLNPLFLDDCRDQLEQAGDNERKLLNLRKRLAKIRVFDPACGSGNFLVIAYKNMRDIEYQINQRRHETHLKSTLPLTNFRGIELKSFAAEIARLALIIAEYQCDVLYRGQRQALAEFLPLNALNWITCGNALRLDWLSVCPPTGTDVTLVADDLFATPLEQTKIDFENEGGETYICGNPPYLGSTWQSKNQKADLELIFKGRTTRWKSLDYVAGWFMKAADYGTHTDATSAFVSTNSICQGQQVPILWPLIFDSGHEIAFAHTSFKWTNLASHNAGVMVVIVGISNSVGKIRHLFSVTDNHEEAISKKTDNINAYLISALDVIIEKKSKPISLLPSMDFGSKPVDDGNLSLNAFDADRLINKCGVDPELVRPFYGSSEAIRGNRRYCLWVTDEKSIFAGKNNELASRFKKVETFRISSSKKRTQQGAKWPYRFDEVRQTGNESVFIIPSVSSETRHYLPIIPLPKRSIVSNAAFGLYNVPLWNMALISSRIHLVWIAIVCGKLKTDFRYSNTLGWNTFPVPKLTEKNKIDLTQCAENILLAREAHFPATIADLYKPDAMPDNLRHAHQRNDEVLERIYIGRRFKNDTERLEKLFDLYSKMTAKMTPVKAIKKTTKSKKTAKKPPKKQPNKKTS